MTAADDDKRRAGRFATLFGVLRMGKNWAGKFGGLDLAGELVVAMIREQVAADAKANPDQSYRQRARRIGARLIELGETIIRLADDEKPPPDAEETP